MNRNRSPLTDPESRSSGLSSALSEFQLKRRPSQVMVGSAPFPRRPSLPGDEVRFPSWLLVSIGSLFFESVQRILEILLVTRDIICLLSLQQTQRIRLPEYRRVEITKRKVGRSRGHKTIPPNGVYPAAGMLLLSNINYIKLICVIIYCSPLITMQCYGSEIISSGTSVVQAAPTLRLLSSPSNSSAHHREARTINIYQVRKVDGVWLFLEDDWGALAGWVRSSEVVRVDRGVAYFTQKINSNKNIIFYILRSKCYRCLRDLDNASGDIDKAIHIDPLDTLVYRERAAISRVKQEYDRAIEDLDRAIQMRPQDPINFLSRALVLRDIGENGGVIGDLTEAIRLDPSYLLAYYLRARTYQASKKLQEALADFSTAINLNPEFVRGYVSRGICWNSLGEYDKAISDFNHALHLNGTLPYAYTNRGSSWLFRKEYDKAISDFNAAIRLDPNFVPAYVHRSIAWIDKGEYDNAIMDSSEALRINPKHSDAFYRRGRAWLSKGEYGRAIEDYKRAISLDEHHAGAHSDYAWILATCPSDKYRDGKKAVELAQEACELAGWRNPYFVRRLAASYAEAGDFDSAILWQKDALRLLEGEKADDISNYKKVFQDSLEAFKQRRPYRE